MRLNIFRRNLNFLRIRLEHWTLPWFLRNLLKIDSKSAQLIHDEWFGSGLRRDLMMGTDKDFHKGSDKSRFVTSMQLCGFPSEFTVAHGFGNATKKRFGRSKVDGRTSHAAPVPRGTQLDFEHSECPTARTDQHGNGAEGFEAEAKTGSRFCWSSEDATKLPRELSTSPDKK